MRNISARLKHNNPGLLIQLKTGAVCFNKFDVHEVKERNYPAFLLHCSIINLLQSISFLGIIIKKSSLYSWYYAQACNEWRDSSPIRNAWPTQLRETSQRWRAVGDTAPDLTDQGIEPQTSRTDSDALIAQPSCA